MNSLLYSRVSEHVAEPHTQKRMDLTNWCQKRCQRMPDLPFLQTLRVARTKLAALYSATKSLQNSCTAKLQLFSSVLEAKQQLNSSCSGMQKRCAAFEALGSGFAAQLPTFKSCEIAAVTLQFSCARSDSTTFLR